jgi:hypothetical protein
MIKSKSQQQNDKLKKMNRKQPVKVYSEEEKKKLAESLGLDVNNDLKKNIGRGF